MQTLQDIVEKLEESNKTAAQSTAAGSTAAGSTASQAQQQHVDAFQQAFIQNQNKLIEALQQNQYNVTKLLEVSETSRKQTEMYVQLLMEMVKQVIQILNQYLTNQENTHAELIGALREYRKPSC